MDHTCHIVVPDDYDLCTYYSTRGMDENLNKKINRYTSNDLKNIYDFADFLYRIKLHYNNY